MTRLDFGTTTTPIAHSICREFLIVRYLIAYVLPWWAVIHFGQVEPEGGGVRTRLFIDEISTNICILLFTAVIGEPYNHKEKHGSPALDATCKYYSHPQYVRTRASTELRPCDMRDFSNDGH